MDATMYSWETTFDTVKDLMIHTFSDRVKVVSNIRTGIVKVLKDGDVISTMENAAISEYENFLSKVAIDAHALDELNKSMLTD